MVLTTKSPFSSAFVVSGLIHLGLIIFLVAKNFGPSSRPTEVGLIGNFITGTELVAAVRPKAPVVPKEMVRQQSVVKTQSLEVASPEDISDSALIAKSGGAAGAETQVSAVPTLSGANSQAQYDEYTRDVLRMIHQKKVYPRMAQKMGHTGKILVKLRVARDGSVQQSEVVEESRYSTLNEAARKLLVELQQMKPFPVEVSEKFWVFHVPIEYKL